MNMNDRDLDQHYQPGTQEIYNSFSSRNLIMKNGNELETSEGRGGGKGVPLSIVKEFSSQFANNIITNIVRKLTTKFISLGRHCDIKLQIDKFTKGPNLFFDWLRSDFKAVIKVFSYTNIKQELLFYDNIITHPYDNYNIGVEFKNMIMGYNNLFLLSHHDIAIDTVVDENVIQNFINKYERRWHRVIDIINNSNQPLLFLHRITNINAIEKIDPGDEDKFIELISRINPKCKFCLVFLIHNEESSEMIIKKRNKFLCINIEPFLKSNCEKDWKMNQYDWNQIFETILCNVQY
jgi:hypothetical protein